MAELLEVKSLTKRFGGLVAVNGISFAVREGEILSVIGPNGAGKSTLFKLIASFMRPSDGEVLLQRRAHLRPSTAHRGPRRRGAHLPGNHDLQGHECARKRHHCPPPALARQPARLLRSAQTPLARDEIDFASSSGRDPRLSSASARSQARLASTLPQGHLRALGIAIGLATNPKILLLDEPFAGMNHDETRRAVELVRAVRERGVTILLVEHDMPAVMKISDRIVVLNFGEKIAEGTPSRDPAKPDA